MAEEASAMSIYQNIHRDSEDAEAARRPRFRMSLLFLGILGAVLVGSIVIIVRIVEVMYIQEADYSKLMVKMSILENENEKLIRERDELNQTLEAILSANNVFCPDRKCQRCLEGWMAFEEKCYYIFDEHARFWKTWEGSRSFCQNQSADLVVINSLKEQEFISSHVTFYYDQYHGYWIGLHNSTGGWVWIDGQKDNLQYWMEERYQPGPHVQLIPGRNFTRNWEKANSHFRSKFICEKDALTYPC